MPRFSGLDYALYRAVKRNNYNKVLSLLEAGANPNVKANGRTALEMAVVNDDEHYDTFDDNTEICKLLLEHGAKLVNGILIDAVHNDYINKCKLLIKSFVENCLFNYLL